MIYFDNNATTQIAPEVIEAMHRVLIEDYGNPSSAYIFGRRTRGIIEEARRDVARLIGAADPGEVVFTSGGTESDNWAIRGALRIAGGGKKHVITTRVEHEAVRQLCEQLAAEGFEITWLEVDSEGALDPAVLKRELRPDTAVVSIMLANNETGILFPVAELAGIVRENSAALFHVDGVNAVGKMPVDLNGTEIDLFSLSGHKFHAPKGIGALYIRQGVELPPFLIGGGQENRRRAGTEAVHQIAGLGRAAQLALENLDLMQNEIRTRRDRLERGILDTIGDARLNGTADPARRLPNTSNISFPDINGEAVLARLSDLGVCVSTGSACNAETHEASPVLKALDIPYRQAMGAVRFSLGRYNTADEVDFVLEVLPEIIGDLKRIAAG